jgi:hypothetical protein
LTASAPIDRRFKLFNEKKNIRPVIVVVDIDHVFVLRFWQEGRPEFPKFWRARIGYLNNGQELYADSIEKTFDVVRSLLEDAGRGCGTGP